MLQSQLRPTEVSPAALAARVRTEPELRTRVELAACLGHALALAIYPHAPRLSDPLLAAAALVDLPDLVRFGCCVLERVFEAHGDAGYASAQRVVVAARAWADCPCAWHQDAASAELNATRGGRLWEDAARLVSLFDFDPQEQVEPERETGFRAHVLRRLCWVGSRELARRFRVVRPARRRAAERELLALLGEVLLAGARR